jgi:acyl-CoA synthetase (AMP-forming)/AMP-acid ligase II
VFDDLRVGDLREPLTGRAWDSRMVRDQCLRRMAHYTDLGLKPFDRVFLHHGNTLEFFADLLAIWRLGGCAIPIDSRLTPFEIEMLAGAAVPRLSIWREAPDSAISACLARLDTRVVGTHDADERMKQNAHARAQDYRPSLDDDALILFTSGTTGQPKGVVHTHRSLRARWSALRNTLDLDAFRRTLCLLPTHFGHGLICNCLFPWLSGQDLFILPPFKLDVLTRLGSILDEFEITFMSSVPAVWRLALKTARPPRSATLNRVFCGSAPLSATLWNSIRDWTGAGEVLNAYGITETGSWLAGTTVPGFTPEDGLIGVAWGGVLRILTTGSTELPLALAEECPPGESGYVWTRTPALMRGYLGRDDLTDQVVRERWFSTGDIGFVDDRGVLYLRGREREEINKGGMKIHPGDVDAVVERFGHTIDVCTFGYEDALQGQDVGIAVVLHSADEATLYRLYDWTRRHLAVHQLPQRWYVVYEIPRNARGKVNRATVAARCANLKPRDVRKLSRPDPGSRDP